MLGRPAQRADSSGCKVHPLPGSFPAIWSCFSPSLRVQHYPRCAPSASCRPPAPDKKDPGTPGPPDKAAPSPPRSCSGSHRASPGARGDTGRGATPAQEGPGAASPAPLLSAPRHRCFSPVPAARPAASPALSARPARDSPREPCGHRSQRHGSARHGKARLLCEPPAARPRPHRLLFPPESPGAPAARGGEPSGSPPWSCPARVEPRVLGFWARCHAALSAGGRRALCRTLSLFFFWDGFSPNLGSEKKKRRGSVPPS